MRAIAESFLTLFVVMDPVGLAPIFLTLTAEKTERQRFRAGVKAAVVAGALIVLFALGGDVLLGYLHVSVQSLSIAGGLLLLLVALEMVRTGQPVAPEPGADAMLVPLATPMLAGPGAIAAVLVLIHRNPGNLGRLEVIAGIVLVVAVVALILVTSGFVARRLLRPSVIQLLTRLFGLLLAAIAVQLVSDAVAQLVRR